MSDSIEAKLNANLERWRASGQPAAWCAAHHGVWTDGEWLSFVSAAWWSEYWPMDPAAMHAVVLELTKPWNLERWCASAEPWQWLDAHRGVWDHAAWLGLLDTLRQSEYWPLEPDAVGAHLEALLPLWQNLERWKMSGLPAQWVEAHQGEWNHGDWLDLLDSLKQSEYWPLDPNTVGQTLEEQKMCYHNLIRWQLSDHPRRWVDSHQGTWDTAEWDALLAALAQSEFAPLDPASVARVIEGHQRAWWPLRRWRDAGLARRWVEAHAGHWNHDDWLHLLATLRASGYWPIDPDALGVLLEETRTEWLNLRRWQASGQPQHWVAAHGGSWREADLDALFEELWQSAYWPLDVRAVHGVLAEAARALPAASEPAILRLPLRARQRAA